jgi:epoxyqueuosine reductase
MEEHMAAVAGVRALTNELRQFVESKDVDLFGIAPVSSYDGAGERMHPRYYIPDAQAVIVLGLQVPRPIVEQVKRRTTPYPYQRFARFILNDELDTLANQVSRFLARRGYECLPTPANDWRDPRTLTPLISHVLTAVAAGLGEVGWHNMLLTPQFGPRQKLVTIITNAPLEPGHVYEGDPICDRCMRCVEECNIGAISPERTRSVTIDGRKFEWGALRRLKCIWECEGLTSQGTFSGGVGPYSRDVPFPEKTPSPEEIVELQTLKPRWAVGCSGRCYAVCNPNPELAKLRRTAA